MVLVEKIKGALNQDVNVCTILNRQQSLTDPRLSINLTINLSTKKFTLLFEGMPALISEDVAKIAAEADKLALLTEGEIAKKREVLRQGN